MSTAQLSLIEQRVANDAPSAVVAYLLWFFVGILSAHRFYLGRPGTALLQILSYFIIIGFIWLLIDVFLIPGMIREKQDAIRHRMTTELLAHSGTSDASSLPA
jgi:TM2 domain-containing membrane protein YozV